MSAGERMPLDVARAAAARIVADLAPYCERIEVAGSIRRGAETVGDVELVAIPRTQAQVLDLLGMPVGAPVDLLDERLNDLLRAHEISKRGTAKRAGAWGPRQKSIAWQVSAAVPGFAPMLFVVPVDLFVALPTTWGAVLAIRTGPHEWSKRMVTARAAGGLRPNHLKFEDGGLWAYEGNQRRFVPTPEEEGLFRALGLTYVEPGDRHERTQARDLAGRILCLRR